MLETFLLCAIGSVADLIKIGIETMEGASISELTLRVFMRGAAIAYPYQVLKRVRTGRAEKKDRRIERKG